MREPVSCKNCDTHIGYYITYSWGPYGQDPPEYDFFNEDEVVFDEAGNAFCSRSCYTDFHEEEYKETE